MLRPFSQPGFAFSGQEDYNAGITSKGAVFMDLGTPFTPEEKQRILDSFLRNGVLTKMPSQRKKQLVIIEAVAARFEPGRDYAEREVNAILQPMYEDFVTLRRDLVDAHFMTRDHGIYRRVVDTETENRV
jgi:hypothetical protein